MGETVMLKKRAVSAALGAIVLVGTLCAAPPASADTVVATDVSAVQTSRLLTGKQVIGPWDKLKQCEAARKVYDQIGWVSPRCYVNSNGTSYFTFIED
jgi:hypothetical protein